MTLPYLVQAPGLPIVNQHQVNPDGGALSNPDKDCGEACIASVLRYIHGVTMQPDEIKDQILGEGGTGPTSPLQLQAFLQDTCNIPCSLIVPNTQNGYLWNEWNYLRTEKPLIALRYWETVGSPYLHWCVVQAQTEATVVVMDPWTGSFVTESYNIHYAMAQGHSTLIGIDRGRDL